MAVKIRLARQGARNKPQFLIVVVDKAKKRDGEYLDKVGYYYPKAKTAKEKVQIKQDVLKKWMDLGARPTQIVGQLIRNAS